MARRVSTTRLIKLFQKSTRQLYVVDDQRKIVFCNPACCGWLGTSPEEITGKQTNYQSQDTANSLFDTLCPPPEAFEGQFCSTTITNPTGDTQAFLCLPLRLEGDAHGVLVLATAGDELATSSSNESDDLHAQLQTLRNQLGNWYQLEQLIGDTPGLHRLRNQILLANQSKSRVLIIGPQGSSREQFGRVIHYQGQGHAPSTLVPLSCGLLDAELIESTVTAFLSRFANLEADQPPALMLLDVDELAPDAQAMLVGVLGIAEFELQTISTARRPLLDIAAEGSFRTDLANMLSTLVIEIPPLKDHHEDIPVLAQYFLERQNERRPKQLSRFTTEAQDALAAYHWPNNLDELKEIVRVSCERAVGPTVGINDLPERIHFALQAVAYPRPVAEPIDLDSYLEKVEEELIRRALEQADGNKTRAAGLLGITRARLHRKLGGE